MKLLIDLVFLSYHHLGIHLFLITDSSIKIFELMSHNYSNQGINASCARINSIDDSYFVVSHEKFNKKLYEDFYDQQNGNS